MTCHFNTKFPVLDSCFRVNFNTRVIYSMPVLPEHAINFNQILTILLRRSRILVLLRSTNQSPLPLSLSTPLHHKLLLRTQILVSIFVRTMMQCFVLHVFRHTLFFIFKDFYITAALKSQQFTCWTAGERPWEAQNLNNDAMAWQKDSNWGRSWKGFRWVKEILWDSSPV